MTEGEVSKKKKKYNKKRESMDLKVGQKRSSKKKE